MSLVYRFFWNTVWLFFIVGSIYAWTPKKLQQSMGFLNQLDITSSPYDVPWRSYDVYDVIRHRIYLRPTLVAMASKFELKLAITQLIRKISRRLLRLTGGFRVRLSNNVSQILPRPTLVPMATKYGSKLVITQLVWQIFPISLRLTGGFRGPVIEFSAKFFKFRCNGNRGQSWLNLTNIV